MDTLNLKAQPFPGWESVPHLADFNLTIDELIAELEAIKYLYGGRVLIACDAGHNNVEIYIKKNGSS